MKKSSLHLIILLCALPSLLFALGNPSFVDESQEPKDFPLVQQGKAPAMLWVDAQDEPGVARALGDLQKDIARVTGQQSDIVKETEKLEGPVVLVGTLGSSSVIDKLVSQGKIDVSEIEGVWEASLLQVVENPLPGIKQAFVIVGSDRRGTIYGIYELSEQIGVSPWYWWADVPPHQHGQLFIDPIRITHAPKVQYRGIFLNDEAPALSGFVHENYGNFPHEFYVKVFELILRQKGNFLWPAMWSNAFADDDPLNAELAHEYGIVMSTSHHEPMMRADKEWDRYGEGPWDYDRNPDKLYDFWVEGAERYLDKDCIFTMGMRGQQDTPMSETENIGLLEKIVHDQRQILDDVFREKPLEEIPQVWALYKEVQGYYEKGMRVDDDITLLWCDDNWGNIRRLPTPEERARSGGAGVYYHFDYVGGPRSYKWMNVITLPKIWEQMNLAYEYNARKIWIVNVGDLKPMEYPIEFFLSMAWDPEAWTKDNLVEYGQLWATREFGAEYAAEIERIMNTYTQQNYRRHPELLEPETYSVLNYREAEGVLAELDQACEKAEEIYQELPEAKKDAFYQLVLHPIKSVAVVNHLYIAAGYNRAYAYQGRVSANAMAEEVKHWFDEDAAMTRYYHEELADGKWNHFMAQTRIGYTYWNQPPENVPPPVSIVTPIQQAYMGVALEGQARAYPMEGVSNRLYFDFYGQADRFIELFNRGSKSYEATLTADQDWIHLDKTQVKVGSDTDARVYISIDWKSLKTPKATGSVMIEGPDGQRYGVVVLASRATIPAPTTAPAMVEADGFVSIEAADYSARKKVDGLSWQEIPNHGRTQSGMAVYPVGDRSFDPASEESPYLEYQVYFQNSGSFDAALHFGPTLAFVPGRGLRYAIAVDDQAPVVIDLLKNKAHSAWQEAVRTGVRKSSAQLTINEPGYHTIRIYMVDPAAVLQKIVINTGHLQDSYLGPQSSTRLSPEL